MGENKIAIASSLYLTQEFEALTIIASSGDGPLYTYGFGPRLTSGTALVDTPLQHFPLNLTTPVVYRKLVFTLRGMTPRRDKDYTGQGRRLQALEWG